MPQVKTSHHQLNGLVKHAKGLFNDIGNPSMGASCEKADRLSMVDNERKSSSKVSPLFGHCLHEEIVKVGIIGMNDFSWRKNP